MESMNTNENRIPRMRTLPKAMEEIKKADPGTQLTLATLRKMVERGLIGTVPLGNYRLVDLDKLLALLSDGVPEEDNPPKMPVGRKRRNPYADCSHI